MENKFIRRERPQEELIVAWRNLGKKQYSASEKAAYHAGRGYKKAQQGKRFGLKKGSKEAKSFSNGYRSVK